MSSAQKVVIYRRVSTKDQAEDGSSLDQQHEALTKYATDHGYEIVGEFADEGISGSNLAKREGIKAAMTMCKREGAILLAYSLSRISRSVADMANIIAEFDKKQLTIQTLQEQVDPSTPAGRMTINIIAAAAQYQREAGNETIKANMQSGKRKNKRQSRYAPFGYEIVGDDLVTIPAEQKVIKRIMRDHTKGLSPYIIAKGLTSPERKWQTVQVQRVIKRQLELNG
jgi:site-specific DNA recombinase